MARSFRCHAAGGACAPRQLVTTGLRLAVLAALAVFIAAGLAGPAAARGLQRTGQPHVYTVSGDPGGRVDLRAEKIRELILENAQVRIVGRCNSACTMYLGVPRHCVGPKAVLGFHGPTTSRRTVPLPKPDFDHWSRVMALHYPEPLKSWFMKTGRYRLVGRYTFTGRDLIRMGVPACR